MFTPAAGRPIRCHGLRWGVLMVVLAGVAAGCGDAPGSGDPGAAEAADPADPAPGDKPAPGPAQTGGAVGPGAGAPRIVVGVRRLPATLDPVGDLDPWGQRVVDDLLFEGLTRRVSEPVAGQWTAPALADRCVPLTDGRTVACHLRDGARFHDDAPVTVDDVVFSVNLWLGNRGATLRQRYGLDDLRTVEAGAPPGESGGGWVRLGFAHASPLVLEKVAAMKVVPKRLYGGPKFAKDPVGSGPMRLRERQEDRLIFARAAGPELELRAIPDGAMGITALRRGEIHVLVEASPGHVPGELSKPGMATRFRGFLVSPAIYDMILYNLREGAQAGPRLRAALDEAVPRGELVKVYGEPGLATRVPVDLHAPSEIDLVAITDNRMDEAGLDAWAQPERGDDAAAIVAADRALVELGWVIDRGIRRRGTTNLRVPLAWDGSPGLASGAARAVRNGWKQLGISAPNVTAGWAYVLTLLRAGKYSVALARLGGGSDVDLSPWFHSRGVHNLTGISDGQLDAALEAYRQAGDRAARDAAKVRIAERLAAVRPVTVLHAPLQVMLVSRALTGLEFVDDLPRLDRLGLAELPPQTP